MTAYVIRPNMAGGAEMIMESTYPLTAIPRRFAETIGLVVVNSQVKTDPNNNEYIDFTIGTGQRFVAFDKKILD